MISSKDNNIIKLAKSIKEKKYSKMHNLCLVETQKIVSEMYKKGLINNILVIESKYDLIKSFDCKIDIISESIAKYLSDTMSCDGVFAICNIPNQNKTDYSRCLILDGLQDPSNIGAIIRSACAFGFKTIFAINSVYPYAYKCIRSSMGYIFDINYIDTTYDKLIKMKQDENITFISADMNGENIDNFSKSFDNLALIIGNEGNGVSEFMKNSSDITLSIPMKNNVESLNASVSAGILMYILR